MNVKVWFRCAVVFDPVCPKILTPCAITWEAKYRDIDLVIERKLKGNELVMRMKGWITVEPSKVIEIVEKYGRFKINNLGELYVELNNGSNYEDFKKELEKHFNDQVTVELLEQ